MEMMIATFMIAAVFVSFIILIAWGASVFVRSKKSPSIPFKVYKESKKHLSREELLFRLKEDGERDANVATKPWVEARVKDIENRLAAVHEQTSRLRGWKQRIEQEANKVGL